MVTLKVQLVNPDSVTPTKGSVESAGYDLYSCEDTVVGTQSHLLVKTGIKVGLPLGTYGRVAPRSGLAYKKGIDVGAGVIDRDYTGEVGVILFNHGSEPFEVKKGDRIAQLVITKIENCELELVDEMKDTDRGDGGFGSTGK